MSVIELSDRLLAYLALLVSFSVPLGLFGSLLEHAGKIFGLPRLEAFGDKTEKFFFDLPGLLGKKKPPVGPLLVLLLFVTASSSACASFQKAPDTAARDAYRGAKAACAVYELAPSSVHNDETDKACRSLRLVCEAP